MAASQHSTTAPCKNPVPAQVPDFAEYLDEISSHLYHGTTMARVLGREIDNVFGLISDADESGIRETLKDISCLLDVTERHLRAGDEIAQLHYSHFVREYRSLQNAVGNRHSVPIEGETPAKTEA